jgi:drug/metabolite transporter (DMT)-like permease
MMGRFKNLDGLYLIMRLKADLTLLMVALLWGSAFAAQRIAGLMGSVYLFNGARFLLAALILCPFIRKVRITHDQWLWMSIAGAILFIASALQQSGMLTTTAGNAGFITSLYVVMVPFVMFVGWKGKLHWQAGLGVVIAITGAFILSTGGRFKIQPGDALELAGALFWAMHVVLLGKYALKFEAISFAAGQFLTAGILNLAVGLVLGNTVITEPALLFGAILYTAIFSVGLGYTLQVWAQRHTPPSDAALILSLEAVFAAFAGWLILNETLSPIKLLGCGLILMAVLLSQVRQRNSGKIVELLQSNHSG